MLTMFFLQNFNRRKFSIFFLSQIIWHQNKAKSLQILYLHEAELVYISSNEQNILSHYSIWLHNIHISYTTKIKENAHTRNML